MKINRQKRLKVAKRKLAEYKALMWELPISDKELMIKVADEIDHWTEVIEELDGAI